jgi:2-polyprenyl-3-methyl-5-hydroxy-6-metoxy-1,4-benzoquinol methylase
MDMNDSESERLAEMRTFYDSTYYKANRYNATPSRHLRRLARKIGIQQNQQVLDVACGVGVWLQACKLLGAIPHGVDLSGKAIAVCKKAFGQGEFYAAPAEALPFEDHRFDVVTCLGALEHFVNPQKALQEMIRVAKPDATFLLLVPNADFLTRRLGLFGGTHQVDATEEVRTLAGWQELFNASGLTVKERWRDLHVLSWTWISAGRWYAIPVRGAQALALAIWPLKWQYQVYHLCRVGDRPGS